MVLRLTVEQRPEGRDAGHDGIADHEGHHHEPNDFHQFHLCKSPVEVSAVAQLGLSALSPGRALPELHQARYLLLGTYSGIANTLVCRLNRVIRSYFVAADFIIFDIQAL